MELQKRHIDRKKPHRKFSKRRTPENKETFIKVFKNPFQMIKRKSSVCKIKNKSFYSEKLIKFQVDAKKT